jgi:hypothetical protein
MKNGELKKILKSFPDDVEIENQFRNSMGMICGVPIEAVAINDIDKPSYIYLLGDVDHIEDTHTVMLDKS